MLRSILYREQFFVFSKSFAACTSQRSQVCFTVISSNLHFRLRVIPSIFLLHSVVPFRDMVHPEPCLERFRNFRVVGGRSNNNFFIFVAFFVMRLLLFSRQIVVRKRQNIPELESSCCQAHYDIFLKKGSRLARSGVSNVKNGPKYVKFLFVFVSQVGIACSAVRNENMEIATALNMITVTWWVFLKIHLASLIVGVIMQSLLWRAFIVLCLNAPTSLHLQSFYEFLKSLAVVYYWNQRKSSVKCSSILFVISFAFFVSVSWSQHVEKRLFCRCIMSTWQCPIRSLFICAYSSALSSLL